MLANLAISDLLTTLIPFFTWGVETYASTNNFTAWKITCISKRIYQIVTITTSLYTLVCIAIERYLSVCHALKHREIATKRNVILMSSLTWLQSIPFVFIPFLVYSPRHVTEISECSLKMVAPPFYLYWNILLQLVLLFSIMLFCYVKIFKGKEFIIILNNFPFVWIEHCT